MEAVRHVTACACGNVRSSVSFERTSMHALASSRSHQKLAFSNRLVLAKERSRKFSPSKPDRLRSRSKSCRVSATAVKHVLDQAGVETRPSLDNGALAEHASSALLQGGSSAAELSPRSSGNLQSVLVLMRHGESMWNEMKLFTGDADIPLTEKGVMEALAGGKAIKDFDFDIIFTSRLVRSKQTALLAMTQSTKKKVPILVRGGYYGEGRIGDANRLRLREAAVRALENAECKMVPVYAHPALNERCYGDLQGLNKEVAAEHYGQDVVNEWRRSSSTAPPNGESLLDTAARAVSYYNMVIEPRLREGKSVLVVAHGNVLRSLIAYLAGLTTEEMLRLQVATAFPYSYLYDGSTYTQYHGLKPLEDFITGELLEDKPMGPASVLKKGKADSLI